MRFDTSAPSLSALQKMLLLRRIPTYTRLDDDDLQLIAENFDTTILSKGDILFRQGEPVTKTYHVIEGKVRIESADGHVEFIDSSMVGIGLITQFAQINASTTAIAEEDTFALVLSAHDISELFEKRSTILCIAIETIARQIHQLRREAGYYIPLSGAIKGSSLPDLGDKFDLIHRTQLLRLMLTMSTFRVSIAFEMARHTQPLTLLAGSELWLEGEEADHFYFIIDGLVECRTHTESESFELGPRDAVALVDILARIPYTYSARAVGKVRALRVPSRSFWRVISDNHEFGISTLSIAARIALGLMQKGHSTAVVSDSDDSDLEEWMAHLPPSVPQIDSNNRGNRDNSK